MNNSIVVIFGRKGTGKTTLARELARCHPRVIVLDALDEYSEGYVCSDPARLADFLRDRLKHPFTATIKARDDDAFDAGLRAARALGPVRPVTVLIEEADLRCSPVSMVPTMDSIIRYGRHWGVSMIAVSRRPAEVSRQLTSQADSIVCFQCAEPRDLEFFARRCSPEFSAQVSQLPEHGYVVHGDPLPLDAQAAAI